jgi:hypothetical protein
VATRYAERAVELARRAGDGFIFRPGPAERGYKNFVNGFAGRLTAGPAAPRPSMSRARSSFICDHLAAYRRVRYCFHGICSVADPSPLPKNRRLTEPDLQAAARQITPAQATAARDRLESLSTRCWRPASRCSPNKEMADFDGSTGLDATPVPLFSRGPSKRAGLAASDPDGGWYIRDGDHREREDHKGRTMKKIAWALEATIATTARPPGAQPARTWPSAWR